MTITAKSLFLGAAIILISGGSFSWALDGVDYTEFEVNGKTYSVPIPNPKTRDEWYMLHKAIDGDKLARKMLLGREERKYFFIGDTGIVRWLVLEQDSQHVIDYSEDSNGRES